MNQYKHLKTGKIYIYRGNVINATNGCESDGVMVLYERDGMWFVREKKEFHNKFKPLAVID